MCRSATSPRSRSALLNRHYHATGERRARRHARTEAPHIDVHVTGSHVTLSGTVSSSAERRAAEQTAWFAAGVTAVDNQVTLSG
ncbi:BON domain-containing protein [Amycolatopsis sp. NPDC058278]|uniref:BON domain-containing protein n=1 Tax=Amycolatopsis sp. NPDC058278 TaxID=3346417 RepID=UPI0036DAA386